MIWDISLEVDGDKINWIATHRGSGVRMEGETLEILKNRVKYIGESEVYKNVVYLKFPLFSRYSCMTSEERRTNRKLP